MHCSMKVIYQELYYLWHKRPLGLKNEVIRIRWSKGKVTVTSQNMFLAINQIKNRELKGLYPKGQRSASRPHLNALQKHISGHYSTEFNLEQKAPIATIFHIWAGTSLRTLISGDHFGPLVIVEISCAAGFKMCVKQPCFRICSFFAAT